MKTLLLVLVMILTSLTTLEAQQAKLFLSEAVARELPKYISDTQVALEEGTQDDVKLLFKTLVEKKLVGTYMDDFKMRKLSKKETTFSAFEKPTLLLTYSSWNINSKGEIEALNELARIHADQVDFIVLYWDKRSIAKEQSKSFSSDINVLYVDEMDNTYTKVVKTLKHSLGLPLLFSMDSDEKIVQIERRLHHRFSQSEEDSYLENFEVLNSNVEQLLFHEEQITGLPVVSQD